MSMNRKEINNTIVGYLKRYGPVRIGIFGSYARREDNPQSDIDILIHFKETITLLELARMHRELSALLGKKVDLVTEPALKNETLRENVLKDLEILFE